MARLSSTAATDESTPPLSPSTTRSSPNVRRRLSTVLSMVREVVFGVGFALLLPLFLGLDGVLWSMPVSDILTFVISVVSIAYTYRTLKEDNA